MGKTFVIAHLVENAILDRIKKSRHLGKPKWKNDRLPLVTDSIVRCLIKQDIKSFITHEMVSQGRKYFEDKMRKAKKMWYHQLHFAWC